MKRDVIETKTALIWVSEEGILWMRVLPKAILNLAGVEENTAIVKQLTKNQKMPLLIDISEIGGITRDARIFSAGKEVDGVLSAMAVLINSPFTRTIGNLWFGINKPVFQSKMFTSEEEALVWLKGFLPNKPCSQVVEGVVE